MKKVVAEGSEVVIDIRRMVGTYMGRTVLGLEPHLHFRRRGLDLFIPEDRVIMTPMSEALKAAGVKS